MKKTIYVAPAIRVRAIGTEMPLATSLTDVNYESDNKIERVSGTTDAAGNARRFMDWDDDE